MANREWIFYFRYTAVSVVMALAVLPLVVSYFSSDGDVDLWRPAPAHRWAAGVVAAQVVLASWSSWRTLRRWGLAEPRRSRRVGILRPDASLVVALAPTAAVAALAGRAPDGDLFLVQSVSVALATLGMLFPSFVALVGGVAVFALARALGWPATEALPASIVYVAGVMTIRTTIWLAAIVRELEVARIDQARLSVAEERLRFARDLHDVAGRDLSTIAVTSELVATLVERGDPRALERSREVAQIARSSLSELRGLVRGYREADLSAELRGTVALLRSAGVDVTTTGAAEDVPPSHADAAAWVLREGGTNILRHADARQVSIALGPTGVRLDNDGARPGDALEEGTGLLGLRERLGPEARLEATHEGARFTLEVRFAGPRPDRPHAGADSPVSADPKKDQV